MQTVAADSRLVKPRWAHRIELAWRSFPRGYRSTRISRHSKHIATAQLQHAVGRAGWLVWTTLLGLRDRSGQTHPTRRRVARITALTEPVVAKAMRRLQRLGLVTHLGRQWMKRAESLPDKSKGRCVWTHAWQVTGWFQQPPMKPHAGVIDEDLWRERAIAESERLVRVPVRVAERIEKANKHGGHRRGAGRKPMKSLTIKSSVSTYLQTKETSFFRDFVPQSESLNRAPSRARASFSFSSFKTMSSSKKLTIIDPDLGSSVGAAIRPEPVVWPGIEPPFPGLGVAPCLKIPDAQVLPSAEFSSPKEDQRILLRVYTSVAAKVFGGRWYAGKTKRPRKHMRRAAEVFRECNIAPHRWVYWVMMRWEDQGNPGPPPIKNIYSAARIRKNLDWFHSEAVTWLRGHTVLSPHNHTLMAAYNQMRTAVRRCGPHARPTKIREAVESVFPPGAYDEAIDECRRWVAPKAEFIEQQLRSWGWIRQWTS